MSLIAAIHTETLPLCFIGIVYKGINFAHRRHVAVKVESYDTDDLQLEYECVVYSAIAGGVGIPKVH